MARDTRAGAAARHRPRRARVDQLRGRPRAADVGVRRHVPALLVDVHLRRRVQGRARRRRHRAAPGLLQLRRPLRRRRRRARRHRGGGAADARSSGSSSARPSAAGSSTPTTGPRSPVWSTARASSSTVPASPAAPAARCTSPRSMPASGHSTGSPTCAGSCRCACTRTPTTTATSRPRCREWKRRDWGAGGDEFHWWCTESADAFVGDDAVYRTLRDEIVEMVGEPVYERLVALLERPRWTPLPHPAVRR